LAVGLIYAALQKNVALLFCHRNHFVYWDISEFEKVKTKLTMQQFCHFLKMLFIHILNG